MQGKVATETNIESGVYEAVLKDINIYTADNFNKDDIVPTMTLIWDLGEDDNGNELTCFDPFINVAIDSEGFPKMGGTKSKMYQRISALIGKKFDPKQIDWELGLPEEYDSPETFLELPKWDSFNNGNSDLERPKADILIENMSIIGNECQIELSDVKNKVGEVRQKVTSCVPMPKKKVTRKKKNIKPIEEKESIEEEELPE